MRTLNLRNIPTVITRKQLSNLKPKSLMRNSTKTTSRILKFLFLLLQLPWIFIVLLIIIRLNILSMHVPEDFFESLLCTSHAALIESLDLIIASNAVQSLPHVGRSEYIAFIEFVIDKKS